jgi:superfamily II DNA or RNA helicase
MAQLTKAAAEAKQATLVISGNSLIFNHRIYNTLDMRGIKATELCGAVDKDVRQQTRHDLDINKIQAVVATTVWDEGVDIPNLRQLILGYGGKSLIKVDQRTGRSLRKKQEGQNVAVIVDFMHYGNDHLKNHSHVRLKRYLEEESYDLCLVHPTQHSNYVRRLLKDKAIELDQLPDVEYYRRLANPDSP